ncbi:hypothetical protein NAI74_09440, partial [Francisella tularensis subsp. holarctica]|nr:hypothetical protein [Francisella tularensis subsp. holarctica]
MKNFILTSILFFIFAAQEFSFDNPNDVSNSKKVTSNDTNMINTVLRDSKLVQQPKPPDSMRKMQSQPQK